MMTILLYAAWTVVILAVIVLISIAIYDFVKTFSDNFKDIQAFWFLVLGIFIVALVTSSITILLIHYL